MLTRLKVTGFKNLVDVDVSLGPFTCVVGPNGSGKSNLFDAIRFLSALANHTLMEAAASVRDQDSRTADVHNLFHRSGDRHAERMSFEAEMLVPRTAVDDLGQEAGASITFLRYSLELARREAGDGLVPGFLEIMREELVHISQRDAGRHLPFPHSAGEWRKSVVRGQRRAPFISTRGEGEDRVVFLHQDGGSSGRPLSRPASLPRTVLSSANAAESPTVLAARREMESWRMLQLEPAAIRRSDAFASPARLGTDGSRLAATLYRLAQAAEADSSGREGEEEVAANPAYRRIAERLSEFIDDVGEVYIDRDEKREHLTLYATDGEDTPHPAAALSDGTLRFLALAVLEMDPETQGVLCLEEPENSIHPARVPAVLRLLRDIAVDTRQAAGPENPLRQVIVNTHSPAVLQQVPQESVVSVKVVEAMDGKGLPKKARFFCLPDTWRAKNSGEPDTIDLGDLIAFLNPVLRKDQLEAEAKEKRVVDREDVRQLLLSPSW